MTAEVSMEPKFGNGAKVRIKARDKYGRLLDPDIEKYEGHIGTVISSKSVVAFASAPTLITGYLGEVTLTKLQMYSVVVDDGSTVQDLTEYFLELL